jgi:hypothetical protein
MIRTDLRFFMPGLVAGLLLAAAPIRMAAANEFTDACVAGSGGVFEAEACTCLDGKVTIASDRSDLIAYFKLNAAALKGSAPTSDDAAAKVSKGDELVTKYVGDCMD